jgi:CBS domain-containing protein
MLRLLYEESATERAVADLMTADVVCFSADDDLTDVCDCFLANSFRRVPILEDGKLAGLISRGDIMKFILESRNQA